MGDPNHELLQHWIACCDGEDEVENHDFSTLLMELFYDYGDEEREFIRAVCDPFDNGRQLAKLLYRTAEPAQEITERQKKLRLKKFTIGDIEQKIPLLRKERQRKLAQQIQRLPVVVTEWEDVEEYLEESELDAEYRHHIENALTLDKDPYEWALSEAVYYGFANDFRFQTIFDTYLIEQADPLASDLELWLLNAEYAVTEDEVLVAVRTWDEGEPTCHI